MADMNDDQEAGKQQRQQDTTTKQTSSPSVGTNDEKRSDDPGLTPGSAEGDRETVEEDLQQKEKKGQL